MLGTMLKMDEEQNIRQSAKFGGINDSRLSNRVSNRHSNAHKKTGSKTNNLNQSVLERGS